MITAHLPSGYITGRFFNKTPFALAAALFGGVFPDIDLIWFYFIDDRAFHHHRYWVHIPAFWACLALVALPVSYLFLKRWIFVLIAFFTGIGVHLVLDTISGGILWGWPLSDELIHFLSVPTVFDNWILNFVLHPSFLLEILIWSVAGYLFLRARNA